MKPYLFLFANQFYLSFKKSGWKRVWNIGYQSKLKLKKKKGGMEQNYTALIVIRNSIPT